LLLFLIYLKYIDFCRAGYHQIFRVGRTVAVDNQIDISFSIAQGALPRQPIILVLSTQLSSGDIRQMTLAYGKKCKGFAGRRRTN